jgi:hypothetical protein
MYINKYNRFLRLTDLIGLPLFMLNEKRRTSGKANCRQYSLNSRGKGPFQLSWMHATPGEVVLVNECFIRKYLSSLYL